VAKIFCPLPVAGRGIVGKMQTLSESTDAELLRAWNGGRCQDSFRALVGKYLGLVRGLALRRTGDAALADEIAQTVFARLAAKAGKISAQPTLAPWLHHCAWCETASAVRRESSRRRHMNAYADHLRASQAGAAGTLLHAALPHLDDALRALPGDDQRIVLMRYYEGRGLRDIAAALGKTEAAVRKQGQRALEKMALRLRRRGTAVSAAALAAGLGAVLSQPASAAAVAVISSTAAAGGASLTLLDHVLALMNTKTKTALVTAACMAVPLAWQWQRASGMEEQLATTQKNAVAIRGQLSLLKDQRTAPPGRGIRAVSGTAGDLSGTAAGSAAEWESALKNPDPLLRSQRLAGLMASLTAESAPQVAELFKKLRSEKSGGQYEMEHRHFLRAWGRLDGEAALANCRNGDGKVNSTGETLAALAGWAQASPDKARAWLDAQEPGEVQTNLALGLIDGWSLADFDAASAFATSLPRSTVRDQFRELLLQRALASGGVPEAQRWFTGIPGDEHNTLYKQRAFDELIGAMMQRDPAGAAEWITRMGRQNFMSGNGIPELASRLASSSPGEALRWLEALGMGEGEAAEKTTQGFASVLSAWSQIPPLPARGCKLTPIIQRMTKWPRRTPRSWRRLTGHPRSHGPTASGMLVSDQQRERRPPARCFARRATLRARFWRRLVTATGRSTVLPVTERWCCTGRHWRMPSLAWSAGTSRPGATSLRSTINSQRPLRSKPQFAKPGPGPMPKRRKRLWRKPA
jgi:RNA polymerase sigma-70 factor (ECF subfamily)